MDFDLAIVLLFLATVLIAGLGYGSKIKTIEDYALGGRKFSLSALVATIVATKASGSGFFITLTRTYSDGLYYLIPSLFIGIGVLITAYVFIPRMGEFLGSTSVAEAMGDLYGRRVRLITALTGAIGSMGFVAVQFSAFGNIVSYFSGIPSETGIIIAGMVVTIYSSMGGVKAVTVTDTLQLFTFCFAVPMIGMIIWNDLYFTGFSLTAALQSPKFNIENIMNLGNPEFLQMLPLMLYFMMPSVSPVNFQRVSMGRSISQVKKATIIAAIIFIIIELANAWIPFLIFNVDSTLESSQLLGYIINNYTYPGLKGLLIVGVVAMAMSTADSHINISSVLLSHDLFYFANMSEGKKLILAKIFALCLGAGGIILALTGKDLLKIILFANSFYMPVVSIPLFLTILGFRSSTTSVLIAMSAGFTTTIVWRYLGIKTDVIIFAMLINMFFLFASHYLLKQPGGWRKVEILGSENSTSILEKMDKLSMDITNFNLKEFLNRNAPNNGLTYMGFGIYCIICTLTTMYSTQTELKEVNRNIILAIYQVMMVTGTLLAMYPIWPMSISKKTKELTVKFLWFPTLFYMLIFFSAFFVMVSDFGQLQFVIFSINTILVILLVGWKLGAAMIISGFYASVSFFKYYRGLDHINVDIGSPQFIFMYSLLLIGAVLLIFLKPKQEYIAATEGKVQELQEEVIFYNKRINQKDQEIDRLGETAYKILNNVNHELRLPIGNVMNFSEMLTDSLENFNSDQIKMLSQEVYKNSTKLSSMILNMLDLAVLNAQKVELQKTTINLNELVRNCITNSRKIYIGDKKINFNLFIMHNIFAEVDPNYIRQVIDNLVINAISFSESGTIDIMLKELDDNIVFKISDQGIGIPEKELHDIFTPFNMASNTESKAKGRGVGLALCKAAIESHGGTIKAKSDGQGATFIFTLPIL